MRTFTAFSGLLLCLMLTQNLYAASTLVPKVLSVGDAGVVYREGKVGVGTSIPQTTLEVSGNALFTGSTARPSTVLSSVVVVSGTTVDWTKGSIQQLTVGNTNLSLTFTPPSGPSGLLLIIQRVGTGTVVFPSSVKWAGGLTPSFSYTQRQVSIRGSATDIAGFTYDGTNYLGEANLDFY